MAKKNRSEFIEALFSLAPFYKRAMFFSVATGLLSLAPVGYMKDLYGPVIDSGSYQTFIMVTVLFIGLIFLAGVCDWIRLRILQSASSALGSRLGERVFRASFRANLTQKPLGAEQALVDLKEVRDFIASPNMAAIMDAPIAILFLIIVFDINPRLGVVATVCALLIFMVGMLTKKATVPTLKDALISSREANQYFTQALKNAQVVQSMGMSKAIQKKWNISQRSFLKAQALASDAQSTGTALTKYIMLSQGSLVLGVGCWLTINGHIQDSGAAMIMASILASRAIQPILQLISSLGQVSKTLLTVNRLDQFLTESPEDVLQMQMPPPKGFIQVEGLHGGAPGSSARIVQDVSFQIPPGKSLAIIGPSGSGKSSLVRFILGIWDPMSGKCRLDGSDVYSWNKIDLGDYLGYLPQDIELFNGSIAENISRFKDPDMVRVEEVAKRVGLHDLIISLPDGYDSIIGEDGAILSGGQKQRLGLARAIYGNPSLVVLDEPDSNLDSAGDLALANTLKYLRNKNTTFIVVSHRKFLFEYIDYILVLKEGRPALFGPKDQVIDKLNIRAQEMEQQKKLKSEKRRI